jgi:hypothetical protein
MSEYSLEERARALAKRGLAGRKRKQGNPMFDHAEGVVEVLKRCGVNNETVIAAAYAHDLIEDVPWIDYNYLALVLGKEVADIVDTLSRREGEGRGPERLDYLKKIYLGSTESQLVKLADVADNISNIKGIPLFDPQILQSKSLADFGFSGSIRFPTVSRALIDYDYFYLPLARRIHAGLYKELLQYRFTKEFQRARIAQAALILLWGDPLNLSGPSQLTERNILDPASFTVDPKHFTYELFFINDNEKRTFTLQDGIYSTKQKLI